MSTPTPTGSLKRKSESDAGGSRSRSRAKVFSSLPGGNNNAEKGRDRVHAALRSILMSPTSFTLFRGFNPTDTANKENTNNTNQVIASIDGLPADLPNFTFFNEVNRELSTVFADAYTDTAAGKPVEKKGGKKVKAAYKGDAKNTIAAAEEVAPEGESLFNDDGNDEETTDMETTGCSTGECEGQVNAAAQAQQVKTVNKKIKEITLTAHVRSKLSGCSSLKCVVRNEAGLNDNEGKASDLMFMPKDCVGVPLGLVEFGLLDDDSEQNLSEDEKKKRTLENLEEKIWEKLDQASNYLLLLRKDNQRWKWEKSLLLGVFVATRDCTMGRFAVFACEPKGKEAWRMALMWRSQRESTAALSEAFGFYLNAVNYLSEHFKQLTDKEIMWEYLGPNCTKVNLKKTEFIGPNSTKTKHEVRETKHEPYVLRSYDNRGRHSSRRSEIYKSWDMLSRTTIGIVFVQDSDDLDTLDFAAAYQGKSLHKKSMLFSNNNGSKGGKVEVIAVPYVVGTHECTSIIHVVSLVRFLYAMQTAKRVHGDVRGLNMVCLELPQGLKASDILAKNKLTLADLQYAIDCLENKVPKEEQAKTPPRDLTDFLEGFNFACLIDFDFGGDADTGLTYPDGYKTLLMDG